MKRLYALLAVLGFVVPYYYFARFLSTNGLNLSLIVEQLFANDISTAFAIDLFIAAIAFWVFLVHEGPRLAIRYWWLCIPATLLVGLSFSLPLFLWMREAALERQAKIGQAL
jgi:hypothetical protein